MKVNKLALAPILLLFLSMILSVQAANWQTVKTFTQNGTTDNFNIPGSEWRIDWSYTPDSQYPTFAAFSFFVYPKGETAIYIESIYKIGANNTSGTTYIHQGLEDYYLKINVANTESFTITVQYDADTVPSTQGTTGTDGGSAVLGGILILIIIIIIAVAVFYISKSRKKKRVQSSPT